jgi:hypothetical protein
MRPSDQGLQLGEALERCHAIDDLGLEPGLLLGLLDTTAQIGQAFDRSKRPVSGVIRRRQSTGKPKASVRRCGRLDARRRPLLVGAGTPSDQVRT